MRAHHFADTEQFVSCPRHCGNDAVSVTRDDVSGEYRIPDGCSCGGAFTPEEREQIIEDAGSQRSPIPRTAGGVQRELTKLFGNGVTHAVIHRTHHRREH